jgi:hypothetical protein
VCHIICSWGNHIVKHCWWAYCTPPDQNCWPNKQRDISLPPAECWADTVWGLNLLKKFHHLGETGCELTLTYQTSILAPSLALLTVGAGDCSHTSSL